MNIGWLEDTINYVGGAELDSVAVRDHSPYEITMMAPGEVADADAYVVANCVFYTPADMEALTPGRPIVKIVNDAWGAGNLDVRKWLLEHANLTVFRSPLHRRRFRPEPTQWSVMLPSWVDLQRFRDADTGEREKAACWVAHTLSPQREAGLRAARLWAERQELPFDAYGHGTDNGPVSYDEMPALLAGYEWYTHAMGRGDYEPFGRATVEAWAAGCRIAVGEDVGALWWIENQPAALETAATDFWLEFDKACQEVPV